MDLRDRKVASSLELSNPIVTHTLEGDAVQRDREALLQGIIAPWVDARQCQKECCDEPGGWFIVSPVVGADYNFAEFAGVCS